jgi:hypothetical protein
LGQRDLPLTTRFFKDPSCVLSSALDHDGGALQPPLPGKLPPNNYDRKIKD